MKSGDSHSEHIFGVIKDVLLIILIFAAFYLIDLKVAAFIAVMCTAILLIRRIILDYNPGFITGHHLIINQKEIIAPKGVDVFDLSKVPSVDYLHRYSEVIRTILVPPTVLIIRFCGILQLEKYDLYLLREITGRLQKSSIAVIFSDVGANVQEQLSSHDIEKIAEKEHIFLAIGEALQRAEKLIKMSRKQKAE